MPLPKSYIGVLQSATPELIAAGVHAVAQLILHLVAEQRLSREAKQRHVEVLRELLNALRAEDEVKP